ncbi:FmdB family zinc ribbon protein [Modestobacter lapidis]|nr:zinc ribbon domain-containing protein [Modestobacter lapidis]
MAVYQYRCPDHGPTETRCAMGSAPATVRCPACGADAARVFTAPRLSFGSPVRRALLDRTEQSRDEPAVVSGPPARHPSAAALPRNPALARLPRP